LNTNNYVGYSVPNVALELPVFLGETSGGTAIELCCVTHLYSSASIGFAPYLLPMGRLATRGSGGWQAGQTGFAFLCWIKNQQLQWVTQRSCH